VAGNRYAVVVKRGNGDRVVGKTCARRCGVVLFLGVLTSIGVAWISAVAAPLPSGIKRPVRDEVAYAETYARLPVRGPLWKSPYVPPLFAGTDIDPGAQVYANRWQTLGGVFLATGTGIGAVSPPPYFPALEDVVPSWARRSSVPWLTGDASWPEREQERYVSGRGWPLIAVWCQYESARSERWLLHPRGAIELPWAQSNSEWGIGALFMALPYRPVWAGLALDAAVYGAAWWMVLFGIAGARRWSRRKRGQCATCAYELRGLPAGTPCPECGTARAM